MPDLGPAGRGGSRRRTRKRMMGAGAHSKDEGDTQANQEYDKPDATDDSAEKLQKLAQLLKDKGVITESEYNLLFD